MPLNGVSASTIKHVTQDGRVATIYPVLFCADFGEFLLNEHQNLEKTSLSKMLYSNINGLRQASSGELARACQEFHPLIVCLSEAHLFEDAPDSFVLLAILWWLDEVDLSMAVAYSF